MHPFITRTITSIILLTLTIGAFIILSPLQLSIAIGILYFYAFVAEFIPLALKSKATAPLATIVVGIAIVITGIVHTYWALDPFTHLYLFICIGSAILSDTGGYLFGNLFGKHLLVPTISPKKTWEGLAGSILFTSFAFFVAIHGHYITALVGTVFALAATLGDLLFSYLKRAAAVKDTGALLPGHGGILDRLDSIIGTTLAFTLLILTLQLFCKCDLFN